jgi:hypothetical protein
MEDSGQVPNELKFRPPGVLAERAFSGKPVLHCPFNDLHDEAGIGDHDLPYLDLDLRGEFGE